jgi:hypothetical protein
MCWCLTITRIKQDLPLSFGVIGAVLKKGAVFGVFNGIRHLRKIMKKPRRMLIYKGK